VSEASFGLSSVAERTLDWLLTLFSHPPVYYGNRYRLERRVLATALPDRAGPYRLSSLPIALNQSSVVANPSSRLMGL
jgi:hypothetical protein